MTVKEGLELIHQLNKKGYVHSIWTFKTPFIGGLCNCTQLSGLSGHHRL